MLQIRATLAAYNIGERRRCDGKKSWTQREMRDYTAEHADIDCLLHCVEYTDCQTVRELTDTHRITHQNPDEDFSDMLIQLLLRCNNHAEQQQCLRVIVNVTGKHRHLVRQEVELSIPLISGIFICNLLRISTLQAELSDFKGRHHQDIDRTGS